MLLNFNCAKLANFEYFKHAYGADFVDTVYIFVQPKASLICRTEPKKTEKASQKNKNDKPRFSEEKGPVMKSLWSFVNMVWPWCKVKMQV